MVDESKDRKQLYSSLKSRPKVQVIPEVKSGSSQSEMTNLEVSSKMWMSGKTKIKVEPFEDESKNPLETSF